MNDQVDSERPRGARRKRTPATACLMRGYIDEHTILLRDGALMSALQVPGLLFETEDYRRARPRPRGDPRGHAARDARCALRALPPRRPPPGDSVELRRRVRRSVLRAHIDRRWRRASSPSGALFVNDQFVTLVRRPARGKAGLAEKRRQAAARRPRAARSRSRASCDPCARRLQALAASLGEYGAQPLGDLPGPSGRPINELLELLSALYNGEMRPVRRPAEDDRHRPACCPIARVSFGLDAMELRGAGGRELRGDAVSLKEYPDATSPGPARRRAAAAVRDGAHRELRAGGAPDRARADGPGAAPADARPTRKRWPSAREMLAARDALGAGSAGFGDHHLTRAGARARPRPARRRRCATVAAGARRHRRDRGARGHQPGARVLGPVPRQRGLPGAPGDDLDRQHGGLRLAARLRARPGRAATTGAMRSRCSRPPARRRSSSTSTTATSAISRSSARRARARRW